MMNRILGTIVAGASLAAMAPSSPADSDLLQKVSDHCYYLQSAPGTLNTGAVITEDGVLLLDPPPERDIASVTNALESAVSKRVRWIVSTDYLRARSGGSAYFVRQGAILIGSEDLDRLSLSAPSPELALQAAPLPVPRLTFGQQMHLFPAGLEVRIMAVKNKARTGGDVVAFVPAEKVLYAGGLFVAGSFPEIDSGSGGSAQGWIDGLKQVIESVPLLKPAMPQPKPDPGVPPEEEKTLEESVIVIPGRGPLADLQQMKDLLSAAQKLRREVSRAVSAGRSRESFFKSAAFSSYSEYDNVESFAGRLFDELSR